jgi:hypothetical protein
MKKISVYILFVIATFAVSCSDYHRNTGRTYAPDMVYSRAVDFYHGTEKIEAQGGTYNKMPAPNTIAREQALPDHIGETDTTLAKAHTCSIPLGEKDLVEGERLYLIYCGICHGTQLDGNGPLYSSGKFAAMPANLKSGPLYLAMSEGRIYHGIVYGKNAMGSYASQLDTKQRWQVVAYIKKVQSENGGSPFTMIKSTSSDSVKASTSAVKPEATPASTSADKIEKK